MIITSKNLIVTGLLAITFAIFPVNPAEADKDRGTMPVGGRTTQPIGHIAFCNSHPGECARRGTHRPILLNQVNWEQLSQINGSINRGIAPVTDQEYYHTVEHWTLPVSHGDCEDYALLKRRSLIQAGWPSGALLIAVVFDEIGDGHAVLVARTDRGDFVLDNRTDDIRRWDRTVYRFVKRQSVQNPKRWVSISDPRWEAHSVSTLRRN